MLRLYKLLGVAKSASKQEIKQAYRNLALLLHPDKHAQSPKQMRDAVGEIFKQITAAHETLTDEGKPDHHHQSHQSYRTHEDQYKKEHQSRQSENHQYKKEHQSRQSENQYKKKEEENSWTRRFKFLDGLCIPEVVTMLIILELHDTRCKDRREKLDKKQESEVEELREKQEGELEELRKRQVRELVENGARRERAKLRIAHERQLEEHRARHQRQRKEQREIHRREISQI